jgi:hypothetical protein
MPTFQLKNVSYRDHSVKLHLVSKSDGFERALIAVYGAAQDTKKPEFLAEFVRSCKDNYQD